MMGEHMIDGEFQSDKYPWCHRGFVPLKISDPMAQPVLWDYAQPRRAIDAAFSDDLEGSLRAAGYAGSGSAQAAADRERAAIVAYLRRRGDDQGGSYLDDCLELAAEIESGQHREL